MNVVSIVWISGEIYYVDEMDAELFDSLKRVKKVFEIMYPKTSWHGETLKLISLSYMKDPFLKIPQQLQFFLVAV